MIDFADYRTYRQMSERHLSWPMGKLDPFLLSFSFFALFWVVLRNGVDWIDHVLFLGDDDLRWEIHRWVCMDELEYILCSGNRSVGCILVYLYTCILLMFPHGWLCLIVN